MLQRWSQSRTTGSMLAKCDDVMRVLVSSKSKSRVKSQQLTNYKLHREGSNKYS